MDKIERVQIIKLNYDLQRIQEIVNDCLVKGVQSGEKLIGIDFAISQLPLENDTLYFMAKYGKDDINLQGKSKDGQAELIEQLKKLQVAIEKLGVEKKSKSENFKKEDK